MACDVKPVQFGKTVPTGMEPFSTVMFRYGSSGDAGVVVYRRTPATSEPVYVTRMQRTIAADVGSWFATSHISVPASLSAIDTLPAT